MPLRWQWQDIDLRFTLNMGDPVEPREFFEMLRRRWLSIIVTATLLTLASVATTTLMMPKAYTASTRVFFADSGDSVSALAPAASIANAVGTELGKAAGDLTPGLANGSKAISATTLSVAQVPTSPSSPNILRNLGLGLLGIPVGALLWLILAKALILLGRRRLVEPYR